MNEDTRIEQRLRTDRQTLGAYVSDASIFRRVPAAVCEPESIADIRAALAYARARDWPVTLRGGGTSVAGNAIGEGLVIDTSRHFNTILDIDVEARTARVQPGVICDDLRSAAAPFGLTYGPDPSTHSRCTIGGMIANNACGSHSLQWGTAADNIVELTVMRSDGSLVTLRRGGSDDPELDAALSDLRSAYLPMLRTELGRFPRQVSGYGLQHLAPENGFDLAKAFAGTEGTCAIIVEALVSLVETPAAKTLAVLAFGTVFDAAEAAADIRRPGVATAEGMGSDLIDTLTSQEAAAVVNELLPGARVEADGRRRAGGWLFCEVTGSTAEEAQARAEELTRDFSARAHAPAVDVAVIDDPDRMRALWRVRESAAGVVTRLPDGREAWPSWEDSAVPANRLGDYLHELYALLETHGLEGIPFGHFGEGCVHLRISFSLGTEDGVAAYRAFMVDAARTVARHGGSLSGEHGDGRARSELLPHMYSPTTLAAFAAFRAVFDPDGLLNPGVLTDPEPLDADLRPGPGQRTHAFVPVHALTRDGGSLVNAVNRCVGVGLCRTESNAMCPSFQITQDEVHSTRGRARILSEMFRGDLYPEGTDSTEVLGALDLCLSCRACASECPVNVDMATYKSEFLDQHFTHKRRPMAHYSMGWLPLTGHLLHLVPGAAWIVDHLLRFRGFEKIVMRLGGVDTSRSMVRFAPRSFQAMVRRVSTMRPHAADRDRTETVARRAILWPDTFSNHLDTTVPRAAQEVLEALGYDVAVPQGFVCCGLTWHSTGQLGTLKKVLAHTLDVLENYLDGATPIVCLEPSCASMLTEELPQLFPEDSRATELAARIVTVGEIVEKHCDDEDWPFAHLGTTALSQVHCHERARGAHDGTASVLESIGIDESTVETGCCGLAGNWGFEPGHAQMSRDLGERELFPRVRALGDDALVLADGFSCRTHIREGTGTDGSHLAQVLQRALHKADCE